ncbi:LysR family transcriptional regulator [Erwinia endophytica]|uniref:LysR family transcriptional regulator n=1 Tax=Erwinia endophytica TaxID=1563158 RepID=UPI001265E4F1|nr:LysR family transcriptional regulator [Erwinia endophytica]KAB8312558.1 LysR family transcriptional regulator [Erwinia endophytica]
MDYRHLQAFMVLSEELHFGNAAQRLNIAQPALSQQLKALEQEVGMALFVRDKRNVALTWEGEQLVAQASIALSHFARFREHASILKQGLQGHLTLGYVGSSILEPSLARLINGYRQANPTIDITIEEHNVDTQLTRLMDDRLDVALIRSPVPKYDQLDYLDLVTRPLTVVLPAQHPLVGQARISLSALSNETFMIQEDPPGIGLGWSVLAACHRAGFIPRKIQTTRDVSVAMGLVAMGAGVTVVPETQRSVLLPEVSYCQLDDAQATTTLTLAWQRRRYRHTLKNFISYARQLTDKVN